MPKTNFLSEVQKAVGRGILSWPMSYWLSQRAQSATCNKRSTSENILARSYDGTPASEATARVGIPTVVIGVRRGGGEAVGCDLHGSRRGRRLDSEQDACNRNVQKTAKCNKIPRRTMRTEQHYLPVDGRPISAIVKWCTVTGA